MEKTQAKFTPGEKDKAVALLLMRQQGFVPINPEKFNGHSNPRYRKALENAKQIRKLLESMNSRAALAKAKGETK